MCGPQNTSIDVLHIARSHMSRLYYGQEHYLFSFPNLNLVLVKMTAE